VSNEHSASRTAARRDEYVLGVNDAELRRLGFQHQLWLKEASRLWERAGVGPGKIVLDLGAGPGFASLDLAQLTSPTGRVIAVEQSEPFLASMQRRLEAEGIDNVERRLGDVQTLDLEDESIDVAYARWVLCFVADPEAVVARVAAALRPGGVFAIQDYYNYEAIFLAPPSRERRLAPADAAGASRL